MATFKPSQVAVVGVPFVATFGNSETEWAAAIIVRACEFHGDRWQALKWSQIQEALRADVTNKREPFVKLLENPFFRPDVHKLIAGGFARWTNGVNSTVEFTDAGLERLTKWVR